MHGAADNPVDETMSTHSSVLLDQGSGELAPSTPPKAVPGWYPDHEGVMRYWDGVIWTGHTAPNTSTHARPAPSQETDTSMAMLVHLSALVIPFFGPLFIYCVKGNESAYLRHHSSEALNFVITSYLAGIACALLMAVLVGFLLLPVVVVVTVILHIVAASKARSGQWYRYPFCLRLVAGAVQG